MYEEFSLEAYGPGGTGILMEITSDNRNRTVAEFAISSRRTMAIWQKPVRSPGSFTRKDC